MISTRMTMLPASCGMVTLDFGILSYGDYPITYATTEGDHRVLQKTSNVQRTLFGVSKASFSMSENSFYIVAAPVVSSM